VWRDSNGHRAEQNRPDGPERRQPVSREIEMRCFFCPTDNGLITRIYGIS
jgi:hypothetical protein